MQYFCLEKNWHRIFKLFITQNDGNLQYTAKGRLQYYLITKAIDEPVFIVIQLLHIQKIQQHYQTKLIILRWALSKKNSGKKQIV